MKTIKDSKIFADLAQEIADRLPGLDVILIAVESVDDGADVAIGTTLEPDEARDIMRRIGRKTPDSVVLKNTH